jgi:hypothetical protein
VSVDSAEISGTLEINITTAALSLALFAGLGGMIGGFVRQTRDYNQLKILVPKVRNNSLELGLLGNIAGSLVCGLILYWSIKFGIWQFSAAPTFSSSTELGTKTLAFVFGTIGGFAGIVVLERLAGQFGLELKPAFDKAGLTHRLTDK